MKKLHVITAQAEVMNNSTIKDRSKDLIKTTGITTTVRVVITEMITGRADIITTEITDITTIASRAADTTTVRAVITGMITGRAVIITTAITDLTTDVLTTTLAEDLNALK